MVGLINGLGSAGDDEGPIGAHAVRVADRFISLSGVHLHAGDEQQLDGPSVDPGAAGAERGVPQLKDGAGACEAGLVESASDDARAGRKDQTIVEHEGQKARASVETRQDDGGNFGQFVGSASQPGFQILIGAWRDKSVVSLADRQFHIVSPPWNYIGPRKRLSAPKNPW